MQKSKLECTFQKFKKNFKPFNFLVFIIHGLFIFLSINFCYGDQLDFLKYSLEKKLPYILSPAKNYKVEFLETNLVNLACGKVNHLLIEGEQVKFKDMPIIDNLKVHLHYVIFDIKKIKSIQSVNFIITLTEEEVNSFLQAKIKIKYPIEIKFSSGGVILSTKKKIKNLSIPIDIIGFLEVHNEKQIYFVDQKMKVSSIPIPNWIRKKLLKNINPIVNMENLNLIKSIQSVEVSFQKVVFSGKAKLNYPIYF